MSSVERCLILQSCLLAWQGDETPVPATCGNPAWLDYVVFGRPRFGRAAWWEALACVFVPEAEASAGGAMGVITVNLADDGPRDAAVVAFEAQRDAEAAAWGWAAAHEAPEGPPRCARVALRRRFSGF